MLNFIKKIFRNIIDDFFYLFPIKKNKIVIDNFIGRGFGDNPKYIAEKIHECAGSPLDIVWLVDSINMNSSFPPYVRKVKIGTIRSRFELATAHIWIDNVKSYYKGKKKAKQFYLQTWHAGITFKQVEKAAVDTLAPWYVKASIFDSTQIDLMISDSDWVTNNYKKNFWYVGNIAVTGFPRNDPFFNAKDATKKKVYDYFNIARSKKIVLYAPTFRENKSIEDQSEIYKINGNLITDAFEKKFGDEFVLLIRLHPNVAKSISIQESKKVKNASLYPDMQELLIASFAEISDFSSSIFDFMLMSDNIFLFARDYYSYIQDERGLNFDIKKDLPFSFSSTQDELVENIMNFDENDMRIKVRELKKSFGLFEDGNAASRVAEILMRKIANEC